MKMKMKTITLTKENIHNLSTSPEGHGFTRKQIMMMGFKYPPHRGWIQELVGVEVTQQEYDRVYNAGESLRRRNREKSRRLNREIGAGWIANKAAAKKIAQFSTSDFITK